jgi:hypothetical protein
MRVQSGQPDRLDGQEVIGHHPSGLGLQELLQLGPPRPVPGRGDGGAEWSAPMSLTPVRRACGTRRRCAGSPTGCCPGPAAAPARPRSSPRRRPVAGYVQRRRINSRCHRSSVDRVTRKIDQRSRGSSFANVARTIRSPGVYRGRVTCRCNRASWCRSTAISRSFASGAGPQPTIPRTRHRRRNARVRISTVPS